MLRVFLLRCCLTTGMAAGCGSKLASMSATSAGRCFSCARFSLGFGIRRAPKLLRLAASAASVVPPGCVSVGGSCSADIRAE